MPKQLITIEVNYPLIHSNGDGPEVRPEPREWAWESLCDDYDNPEDRDMRTYTRSVRLIQASAVQYTMDDHNEAAEHDTTLLELGIME